MTSRAEASPGTFLPMKRSTKTTSTSRRPQWLAPTGLILLSLIPVLAGASRLTELTSGATVTADNSRFFDSPIPVVLHIIGVTVFSLLGAFQFVPSLRQRRSWHRIAGRILVPAGLIAALSGLWMSVFYPLPPSDGQILLVLRLIFGGAMLASLVLGLVAVRRHKYVRHSEWMTRGYAIGVGAGTQALIMLPWMLLIGATDATTKALLMGAAWVINLAVAEYVIHRRRAGSSRGLSRTSGRSARSDALVS
ncbi:DUF2306 domain-containing protein [Leifsonia sp. YAF41]|uniref:DUF2306 domain-containing protein n=1 Tax=Leifsonia sp. YAF41 TaxID=3233086 RepID=UPI003F986026